MRDMLQRGNRTDIEQESITECKAIWSEEYEIVHDSREVYKECRSTEREDRVLQICFADNDSCILDLTSDNTCIKTVYSDDQDSSNSEVKETCGKAKCIIEDKKQQSLTLADLYKQLININLSVQDTRNILV